MEGIDKSFPGVRALAEAHFELLPGEVHALVGENGAGKSTLMKILAGIYHRDGGRILYKGQPVEIPTPGAAQALGISMIHQELNLMPHLTVAQNIFIGREPRRYGGLILDEKAINRQTEELFRMTNIDLDPRAKVANLSVAKQQMVEIAKAVSYDSEVLIMDEPTAALTDAEIQDLFDVIRDFRDKGVGIIYISHRLEELKQISDRITVMRDGNTVDTLLTEEAEIDHIIRLMVGRTIFHKAPEVPDNGDADVVLEVRNMTRQGRFQDVSFTLKEGEILGFAGLMGAGRTEVARAVFGADAVDAGEIYIRGEKVDIDSPKDAVSHGIGYLSEDRKRYGLALGMDVKTNIVLAALDQYLNLAGAVDDASAERTAEAHVETLAIRTPSVHQKVKNLSGGNQQKVVIGKWLTADTDILIFDEPTRGIDVGAKNEIYKLLDSLAREGKAIIMISSELPEILRMSHRVVVMCEGRVTGELPISECTQEKIMAYATRREG
jgi:ribose transport system ATP-binding protein